MKIGHTVKHRFDNPNLPRGKGRVVHWRKGADLALVKWDSGECTEHPSAALITFPANSVTITTACEAPVTGPSRASHRAPL